MTPAEAMFCLVVAVTDGDTMGVRCDIDGRPTAIKIRLAEIDAPEKAQDFGQRSKASLSDLCFGQRAHIKPVAADRYGRTVARVECRGHDASAYQVARGMAWAYTKHLTDQSIKRLETDARLGHVGLWVDTSATPPWDFRRK